MEEIAPSSKDMSVSPKENCLSINKTNLFEVPNSSEYLIPTKSVEHEGEYIFSDRISEYYYNYKDAKELEYQFNLIQKNIANKI